MESHKSIPLNFVPTLHNLQCVCICILQLSLKVASNLSKLDGVELGLADGVVPQEPKTISETNESSEFFRGTLNKK